MTTHQHTGFPVVMGEKIVGIMTLNDAKKMSDDTKKVKDVVETDIICLSPGDDANKAWKLMTQKGIGRFPILQEGELVGIIARSALVHAFQIRSEVSKCRENL